MKLKLRGDGSLKGTIVVDEHDSELEHVELFEFSQHAGRIGHVRLTVSDIYIDIHPAKNWLPGNPKPLLKQPTFNLKIIGDGTPNGTYVINADTEDHIPDVEYIRWGWDDDVNGMALVMEIQGAILDIDPKKPAVPSNTPAPTSGSSSSSPVSAPSYAPSASPSYNPYNPYNPYPQPTCGPTPSSSPPPDGMPLDLMSCATTSCAHDWETYVGFLEVKLVCKKCNAERKP